MKKVTKGNVTIKLWDLGGQPRFRSMWERYCRAVSAIVYETFSLSLSLSLSLSPSIHCLALKFCCVFQLLGMVNCGHFTNLSVSMSQI